MTSTIDKLDLEMLQLLLEEGYGDPASPFAKEDLGWKKLSDEDTNGEVLTRDVLVREAKRARIMSVADPLIRRAVSLKQSYVFGQGVSIEAQQEEGAEQDVNAVIQSFMEDPSNLSTFSSDAARNEAERILATDGQIFYALPTERSTGRVQVRRIPFRQIKDVYSDPEDAESPWLYLREWTTVVIESGYTGTTTRSRRETRRVLYPDLRFRPNVRPKTIDGIPVEWDTPIYHVRVNRVDGSRWGTPDLLAALPWAEGYKGFLEDWAKLIKALSRFAFRATSRGRNSATVRDRIAAADPTGVGGTIVQGEGQKFEAIGKSGATIDSESGRPLAAMVAAAVDVPVTMLLGDPGVTGARATAETLDQPMRLSIRERQGVHGEIYRTILTYVVHQSVKAPQGELKGTVRIDRVTKREIIELANEQPLSIQVDWPSLEKVPMETLIKAIIEADGTNLLPEITIAKLLLMALDVDEPEEILDKLIDPETGEFIPPRGTQSSDTDNAATAATEAYRRGADASEYV